MIELLTRINNSISALTRVHRLLPWLVAYLLLLPLPKLLEFGISDYYIDLANRACLFILLCVGLNIVKGFCGQVTIGHIGLYAIGAVSSALLALNYGLSFWMSAPLAVLITGFAGIIVGLPSVRLEGAYLALATLGLDSFERYYYLVMTAAVVGIYLSFAILRSATGRAFQAIREDPIAASVVGINVTMYKLLAFVISALYAGLGGALFAHMPPGYIHHNNFTIIEMITLLLMVVLGGIGNIWGGVIGAIVVTVIYDQTKEYYFYQPLIFGISMVLLVVFMPRGIGGLIERKIVKQKFIKQHEDKEIGIA